MVGPDGQAIGAVAVGYLMRTVEGTYQERIALLVGAIAAVLGCGLLLALWVQHLLRRTLLDLEPETIANRFAQQDLVLEGISEGIVALDNQHRITMLNSAAFYQLRLPGTGRHALLGRSLAELAPGLVPTLQQGGAVRFTVQGDDFVGHWQELSGREPGRNRLGPVDTFRRYIYLHGTPDSEPMGVPLSHGCIRLRNADLALQGFISTLANIVLKVLLMVSVASMIGIETTSFVAAIGAAGLAIGLALTLIHLISIPVTNTSVNPARSTGVALFVGDWAVSQLWLFWVAPIVGAILGALAYRVIATKE